MAHRWYVVHTYSGFEQKAKLALEERIKSGGVESSFSEILVPSESVVEMKKGVQKTSERQFFPGYILVKMEMNDRTWLVVTSTPKVTGFVKTGKVPAPLSDAEVERITSQIEAGEMQVVPKFEFDKGETVRVIEGPFANFSGTVEEVNGEKQKLKVSVSIFGRSTPIELDFMQVEKEKA